jgi:hypothetical protein
MPLLRRLRRLSARDGGACSFTLSRCRRRADVDSREGGGPQGVHVGQDAQTVSIVDGLDAGGDEVGVSGVVDDVLQLIQDTRLEDLHQIGRGVEPGLGKARQAGLEHQLVRLVRGEAEGGLGGGGEGVAGQAGGAVEEGVDLGDVVGPAVDRVDDVEAAGGLSADTEGGGDGEGEEGGCCSGGFRFC